MADAGGASAAPAAGRLLLCGATDWSAVGRVAAKDAASVRAVALPRCPASLALSRHHSRAQNPGLPNLTEPHRMMPLEGVRACALCKRLPPGALGARCVRRCVRHAAALQPLTPRARR